MAHDLASHIRKESIINGVGNTVFNGLAAWLLLKDREGLALFNDISVDLMATAAILTFIITLISVPLNRRKVAKGELAPLIWQAENRLHAVLRKFPHSLPSCGLLFALFATLVIATLTILALALVGANEFTPMGYSIFKGFWAGALAVVMAFPMILLGLATAQVPKKAA